MRHRVYRILYVPINYKFQNCLKITLSLFSENYHQHLLEKKRKFEQSF